MSKLALTLALSCGLWVVPVYGQEVENSSPNGFSVISEAFQYSYEELQSGHGTGRYRVYERPVDEPNAPWTITTEADLTVYFDDSKYHVELNYQKEPLGIERRIIIYDGTVIAASRFSKLISVTGAETEVFPPPSSGPVKPQLAEFPWDVSKLSTSSLIHVPELIKNISRNNIAISELPSGGYVGEFFAKNSRKARIVFKCPKEYGFNVAQIHIYSGKEINDQTAKARLHDGTHELYDGEEVYRSSEAVWDKGDNLWYIKELHKDSRVPSYITNSNVWRREELKYDHFDVNAEVSPEMFTMNALEMRGGARVLDHRPRKEGPINTQDRIHYVPVEDQQMENKLSSMVEQLSSLPTERPITRAGIEPLKRSHLKWWLVIVNVLGIVIITIVFLLRRRQKTVA